MATDEYGVEIPPVRPDAMPEDTKARPANAFKQALNTFMYGSRDPSYKDVGEFRARGAFQHYAGEGMALSAIARPEVAGSIFQAYANQGALAAQNMRERYYEKEYRQMVQTQILPQKAEFDVVAQEYAAATKISFMPTARTVTPEEAHARGVNMQLTTPAPKEAVPAGKTADGAAKTEVVEGTAPPPPNAAIGQQTMGAVEYTPETLAYMDPATGTYHPVSSQMGQRIEREASDRLLAAHNKLVIGMMDTFAQYPGNPLAQDGMIKIVDGMINASGKAVTGRADPYEQLKFFQGWNAKQKDIERTMAETSLLQTQEVGARAQANKATDEVDRQIAADNAAAADALERAQSSPEFLTKLSPQVQQNIANKKPWSEWSRRDRLEAGAQINRALLREEKDLASYKKAGMIHIPPKQLDSAHIRNWPSVLSQGTTYQERLPVHYAQMKAGIASELQKIAAMDAAEQDKAMQQLEVPMDNLPLVAALRTGTGGPQVDEFLMRKVVGHRDYADAVSKAYMDQLAVTLRDQTGIPNQPDPNTVVLEDNEDYIQRYITRYKQLGTSDAQIEADVNLMRQDPMGTHIMSITGRTAPTYRPYGYGPKNMSVPKQQPQQPQQQPQQPTGAFGQQLGYSDVGPVIPSESADMTYIRENEPWLLPHIDPATGKFKSSGNLLSTPPATAPTQTAQPSQEVEVGPQLFSKPPTAPAVEASTEQAASRQPEDQTNFFLRPQARTAAAPETYGASASAAETPAQSLREKAQQEQARQPFGFTPTPVRMTPEQAMTYPVGELSQSQIKKAMDYIKEQQQAFMQAGDYSPKSVEVYRQLSARLDELSGSYTNWAEDLFRTDTIPQVN